MTTDNTVIKDPANYINSDRLVRFKVSNQSQQQQQQQQQQQFQPQEFMGVSISLSSKGGGQ
jgi:transcription initiation factor TFIID subunit TAF12